MRTILEKPSTDIVEYSPAIRTVGPVYDLKKMPDGAGWPGFDYIERTRAYKFPHILFVRNERWRTNWYQYFACYYLKEPYVSLKTHAAPAFFIGNYYHPEQNGFWHKLIGSCDNGGICLFGGLEPADCSVLPISRLIDQFWMTKPKYYSAEKIIKESPYLPKQSEEVLDLSKFLDCVKMYEIGELLKSFVGYEIQELK